PELVAESQGGEALGQATKLLQTEGPRLAGLALTVPHPAAWLQDARALEGSYEDVLDPADRAAWAERVLADVDDADLVLHAAGRCGVADADLERDLEASAAWLVGHADSFLAAGAWVQAVGQALRPDLAAADPGLGRTADKYVVLLDALEAAEAELSF